jgi:riboflavin kinase/FMN adenylyltransferase
MGPPTDPTFDPAARCHTAGWLAPGCGQVTSPVVQVIGDLSTSPWATERSVLTIGAYDGVHLGHQAVIRQVRRDAEAIGAHSVVVTFDRHPASVVRPESAPKLLTDIDQKLELLEATGVDATVVVHFDQAQADESADSFARRVLVDCLRAKRIVVGEDFHFGHHREGNVSLLRSVGAQHDFDVEPVQLVERPDGVDEPISSTAIRRAMAGGQVEVASRLLGRPFQARGTVVQGDQRGRLLGFPTANVEISATICLPADGVYAGWYQRPDGVRVGCAINLGRRPTFYEHAQLSLLEAHLIDFQGDLYGEAARVEFTHFLRSERKFDGIEALKAQLNHDVDQARGALGV